MACTTQIDIQMVQNLLTALEENNQTKAGALLDELTQLRESELYQSLTMQTNNLNDTLDQGIDNRLLMQTKHDIPDVTERLAYVQSSTEEACSKTLASTEKSMDLSESITQIIQNSPNETQLSQVQSLLNALNTELTNILLAQSFQDLTGQVLNRVVLTISSLEQSLIQLISASRYDYDAIPDQEEGGGEESQKSAEMKGIGPNVTKSSKQNSVNSQDDVDDLLGELGI